MTFDIAPQARQEILDIADWYDEQRPGLGNEFLTELNIAIDKVLEGPHRPRERKHGLRWYQIRRFPYFIVYQLQPSHILIARVIHAKRDTMRLQ